MRTKRRSLLLATLMLMAMTACGDKDTDNNNNNPDTVSGSTIPVEDPDTVSGSTRPAEGAVVKGRIGTGTITIGGQTYTDAYGIDFNKDGYLEYRIVNSGTALQWEPSDANGNTVYGPAMSNGKIATLQKHSSIGPSLDYATSSLVELPETGSLPEKFYVAFRLNYGTTHYGWVKVKYDDGELEWDKCAYNTTPNGTITAGDD